MDVHVYLYMHVCSFVDGARGCNSDSSDIFRVTQRVKFANRTLSQIVHVLKISFIDRNESNNYNGCKE